MFSECCRNYSVSLLFTPINVHRTFTAVLGGLLISACSIYAHATTPTTTFLQIADPAVSFGTPVTLTATVITGRRAVNPGLVKFCDASSRFCEDTSLLGTAQLQSNGTATLKKSLPVGLHVIYAAFAGTQTNAASNSHPQSAFVFSTSRLASTTTLLNDGQQLTATVTGYGTPSLTGDISYRDASTGRNLGILPLSNSLLSFGASAPQTLPDDDTTVPHPPSASNIVVADFNGDGLPDLLFSNQYTVPSPDDPFGTPMSDFYVKLSDPCHPGQYLPGTAYPFPNTPLFSASFYYYFQNGEMNPIAVGDFNGDGLPDIAIILSASSNIQPGDFANPGIIQLLMNDPQHPGQFLSTASPIPIGNNPTSIVVGDFNRDGLPDLAVTNTFDVTVGLLFNTPTDPGQFQPMSTLTMPSNVTYVLDIVTGDFNGDGVLDLAVSDGENGSSTKAAADVMLGDATAPGNFLPVESYPIDNNFGGAALRTGDFNKDGLTDLAANWDGNISVSLAQADRSGKFAPFITYTGPGSSNGLEYIALGDSNGDGLLDIMGISWPTAQGGNYRYTVGVLSNDPGNPGTFSPQVMYPLAPYPTSFLPLSFSVADINVDGLSDWVAAGLNTSSVTAIAALSQPSRTATTSLPLSDVAGASQVFARYSGNLVYSSSKSAPVSTGASTAASPK